MEISDFEVGRTYRITTKDWLTPTGEAVPGVTKVRNVLPPAAKESSHADALPA